MTEVTRGGNERRPEDEMLEEEQLGKHTAVILGTLTVPPALRSTTGDLMTANTLVPPNSASNSLMSHFGSLRLCATTCN